MVTASNRSAVAFSISVGNKHDSPEGELLLETLERSREQVYLIIDRTYEGDRIRTKAVGKGYIPVVPPKKNRKEPCEYDKQR